MKSLTETDKKIIIDVTDEFDYSTQNEEYSKEFKNWRRNRSNHFAFNFSMNKKESIYVDGRGFETGSLKEAENECISRLMYIIGIAMLIWVTIDNILSRMVITVLDLLGFDIHTSIFSSAIFGGSVEIITALMLIALLRLIIPAIYLHKKLKMPKRVEFMRTLHHPSDMICSICMTLVVSSVSSIPLLYNSSAKALYTYFKNLNADISVWDQNEYVVYTIFNVIIIPILAEMLFRGAIFAALRQFGDWFAIIITTLMTGLLVQDIQEFPAAVLISLVASIGMLRSGSLITAIFVRTIYKMYQLAVVIIQAGALGNSNKMLTIFILGTFIIGAACSIHFYFVLYRKNSLRIVKYNSGVSMPRRILNAVRLFPFPAVAVMCLISAIIKIIF